METENYASHLKIKTYFGFLIVFWRAEKRNKIIKIIVNVYIWSENKIFHEQHSIFYTIMFQVFKEFSSTEMKYLLFLGGGGETVQNRPNKVTQFGFSSIKENLFQLT